MLIKVKDLEEMVFHIPDPENKEELFEQESTDVHGFLSKISAVLLEFLDTCPGIESKSLEPSSLADAFGVALGFGESVDEFTESTVKAFFVDPDVILPVFENFVEAGKTKNDFSGFDPTDLMSPSGNIGLLAMSKDFDKILVKLYVVGFTKESDEMEARVVLLPFKKTRKNRWVFLMEKAFDFEEDGDFYFRYKGGGFTVHRFDGLMFSDAWKEAIFATTPEEILSVVVKHYLLVPDDANPLSMLLRSSQPTKGIAKQIEIMLRNALFEG